MLRDQKPERAQQVRQEENKNDQTEYLEALNAEYLSHDLVVVDCAVVALGTIAVDQFDEFVPVSFSNQICEVLQVKQDRDIVHPAKAQQVYKTDLVLI